MSSDTPIAELKTLVEQTLRGSQPEQALLALDSANQELKSRFGKDPFMAVTGDLFQEAEVLCNLSISLATYFAEHGQSQLEERAWELRCSPVLTAHALRRDRVGPALLDWANCNRRRGKTEKADELYDTIVVDFTEILGWGPSWNEDWLLAVRCLQQALEKSTRDYGNLLIRTERMLAESEKLRPAAP